MDDCVGKTYNNGLVNSSSYIICGNNVKERSNGKATADQFGSHPLGKIDKTKRAQDLCLPQVTRPMSVLKKTGAPQKDQCIDARIATPIKNCAEPFCHVRLDSLIKLKDSTRKLLCLLEEIQAKTHSKELPPVDASNHEVEPIQSSDLISPVTDPIVAPALKKLETQTKTINTIYIEDEDDDCSIFKRLTRKCNCLNQLEYNDFMIHFNEDTKYFTSTIGEIIKNMRILKKFLYMGSRYTKNALIFLNEGLSDSAFAEKVEITQGCSHSDMCNVFEDHSIVVTCIALPCKFEYYGDNETQNLGAAFLYKLAQLEEGRRYLKFTSRITNDIKKVLRRQGSKLDMDTTESLNSTLNLLHPPMTNVDVTYYCRSIHEGYGDETIKALLQYRKYMTLDEVFMHLDLLQNLSKENNGKRDLISSLPSLILLFKEMLKEYDNSEMNIIITNILNNIVSKNMLKQKGFDMPKTMRLAEMATEPIKMKNEVIQMPPPPKKNSTKAYNKSKGHFSSSNKFRQASRRKVSDWETPLNENRSKKFKERSHIIFVPIEKEKQNTGVKL